MFYLKTQVNAVQFRTLQMKFAALLILSCVVAAMGQNFQWSFLGSPMKPINEEKPEVDALNFQDTNRPNNRNIPYGRQPHLSHEYLFNPFLNPSWVSKQKTIKTIKVAQH